MGRLTALDQSALRSLKGSDFPEIRYLAARDLSGGTAAEIGKLRKQAHATGAISIILENMRKGGYWMKPGAGYYPKYTGSVWSLMALSQLGAELSADARITTACSYILDHALTEGGQFSVNGLPSGTADCLQGNLCAALVDLGCSDARLDRAFEWMARSVTGEGIAPKEDKQAPVRYYAGKCGPLFACGSNNKLPCAWGAVKVMLAFSKLPRGKRSGLIDRAIQTGINFLLGTDPVKADYPCGWAPKPSSNWWKFGFPVFYVTDMLQNIEALVGLGFGKDKRLGKSLDFIRSKQQPDGFWPLEYDYAGKTWVVFGAKKKPNPWVTLRALRVLKAADE